MFQHAAFSSCGVQTQPPHSMWEVSVPNQGFKLCPLHWKGDSFFFLILFILGCAGSSQLHAGSLQLRRAGSALWLWWRAFIAVTSLSVEPGLWAHRPQSLPYMSSVAQPLGSSTDSVVVMRGVSGSAACEIFGDHGSNSCLLHWQADSLSLSHQGSPTQPFTMNLSVQLFWNLEAFWKLLRTN